MPLQIRSSGFGLSSVYERLSAFDQAFGGRGHVAMLKIDEVKGKAGADSINPAAWVAGEPVTGLSVASLLVM